jgi:predicted RNA-binding Zn-ribbon protein involved in translation (DUF1610 family)
MHKMWLPAPSNRSRKRRAEKVFAKEKGGNEKMSDAFTCPDCGGYIGKEHTCSDLQPDAPKWVRSKIAYHMKKFQHHDEQAKFHSRALFDLSKAYKVMVNFDESVEAIKK